jgi:hypothetical protein
LRQEQVVASAHDASCKDRQIRAQDEIGNVLWHAHPHGRATFRGVAHTAIGALCTVGLYRIAKGSQSLSAAGAWQFLSGVTGLYTMFAFGLTAPAAHSAYVKSTARSGEYRITSQRHLEWLKRYHVPYAFYDI